MKWFAIETSSHQVSLSFGENETCFREVTEEGNASILIEPLYRRLQVNFDEIQQCVIGKGPGSYNGLRVGYAFLKGLLCLRPVPVIEIPTPLILAAQASESLSVGKNAVLILNNARRGEVYGAIVEIRNKIPQLIWEMVCPFQMLLAKLPQRLDAMISSDYTANDLTELKSYPWFKLFPSSALAGALSARLSLPSKMNLSELEPHYVRPAIPKD